MKHKGKKNTEIVCLQSPEGKRSRTIQGKPSVRQTGRVGGKLLGTGLESQQEGGRAGRKSWEAGSSTAGKRWRSGAGWQQAESSRSNRWQQSALDLAAVLGKLKLQPERKEPKQNERTHDSVFSFPRKGCSFHTEGTHDPTADLSRSGTVFYIVFEMKFSHMALLEHRFPVHFCKLLSCVFHSAELQCSRERFLLLFFFNQLFWHKPSFYIWSLWLSVTSSKKKKKP